MQTTPFNVGDIIHLSIDKLRPAELKKYDSDTIELVIKGNKRLGEDFGHKTIKIIEVYNSVNFKIGASSQLTIDYYCEFIED
ncbi:MAG: hypothetical protein GY870_19345 [archaeon]|nr:hypothetical protein [archaeon]